MSKDISNLIPDIQELLGKVAQGESAEFTEEELAELGAEIATAVARQLNRGKKVRTPKTLYMSEVGQPCKRKLWFRYQYDTEMVAVAGHTPEPLHPNAILKFLYGDIIESIVLALAKKAGHDVQDEQKAHSFTVGDWEIRGRQDARIDGHLVDVKSASSFAMKKFRDGITEDTDSFGYIGQLSMYLDEDDDQASFLAIDKQTGSMVLDTHTNLPNAYEIAMEKVDAVSGYVPPPIEDKFQPVPDGKSGNKKLCTNCGYCEYRQACWAVEGKDLRGFLYSSGPRWLTDVVVEPKVMEITNDA